MSITLGVRRRLAPVVHFGTRRLCNVCDHRIREFVPLGSILGGKFTDPIFVGEDPHQVTDFETLNVPEFMCPICGSQDKARLYALYMSSVGRIPNGGRGLSLLHFAPEGGLAEWIRRSFPELTYVTTDLLRPDVDVNLDVTRMDNVETASFDAFIFSHVLEHVAEEDRALSELLRILKPAGWGIIMVPILLSLSATYTDVTITDPASRARHFGLEDHLRVHSREDFLKQLESAGFVVREYTVLDWSREAFVRLGISLGSVLYVVSRP